MERLTATFSAYPHTQELLAGPVRLSDGRLVHAELRKPSVTPGELAGEDGYDVFELPLVNYISFREHGLQATAIPVFLTRRFAQGMIYCNRKVGIVGPADLEGKRVSVMYHGNTDVVWARGVLSEAFGVDLDRITWVAWKKEQIPEAPLPANVELVPNAEVHDEMLLAGELAAAIYGHGWTIRDDRIEPLFGDVDAAERTWFNTTGIFPVLHTIVVRNGILAANPGLASALIAAFQLAKDRSLVRLESRAMMSDEEASAARLSGFPTSPERGSSRSYLGVDPLPYGLEPNRANVEMLVRFAREQHVISTAPAVDELFATAEETRGR